MKQQLATEMPTRLYTYDAECLRVVDGDSVQLVVSLGAHVFAHWDVRLLGYDAPGRFTAPGKASTAHLRSLLYLPDGTPEPLRVLTFKDEDDLYGRLLAQVWRARDGHEVRPAMVEAKHGVQWDGTGGHPAQPGAEKDRST